MTEARTISIEKEQREHALIAAIAELQDVDVGDPLAVDLALVKNPAYRVVFEQDGDAAISFHLVAL